MTNTANQNPSLTSIVLDEIVEIIPIQNRCIDNLKRLARIIKVNMTLDPEKLKQANIDGTELIEYLNDIHRAIIVFSHSTIESATCDIVQYLLKLRYSYNPEAVLLLLEQKRNFTIEDLKSAGNKPVDQMIQEYMSDNEKLISEFVSKKSFNQRDDIVKQLKAVGLNTSTIHHRLTSLNEMMNRRHNIAHKFDYIETDGRKQLNTIEFGLVQEWTTHLMDFLQALLKELLLSDCLANDIQGKARSLGVTASTNEIKEQIKVFLNPSTLDTPWSEIK